MVTKKPHISGVCDGTVIECDGLQYPVTLRGAVALCGLEANVRIWCAHGWQDIESLAVELLQRFPYAETNKQDGVSGMFNVRGHFYTLKLRLFGGSVEFCDIQNVARADDIQECRDTFGGATDIETVDNMRALFEDYGMDGSTVAAMAMHSYISGDYATFKKEFPPLEKQTYLDMRPSYFGAVVYAEPGEYKQCSSWDVNSMYPYIMREKPMPHGAPKWFDGRYEHDDDMPLSINIVTLDAELLPHGVATLTNIMKLWGFEGVRQSRTCGFVDMVLTDVDLRLIEENYSTHVYEYVGGWKFRQSRNLFREYVDTWYPMKRDCTGERRQIAKYMLNALSGKFGSTLYRPILRPRLDDNGHIAFRVEKPDNATSLSWLPVAAYINAYGREILAHAIRDNRERVIYADTDSMILQGLDAPNGVKTGQTELGRWKNDYSYKRLRILGTRKYCGVTLDGETEMRLSGVHRKAPIPYDEFVAGARHMNDSGSWFVL